MSVRPAVLGLKNPVLSALCNKTKQHFSQYTAQHRYGKVFIFEDRNRVTSRLLRDEGSIDRRRNLNTGVVTTNYLRTSPSLKSITDLVEKKFYKDPKGNSVREYKLKSGEIVRLSQNIHSGDFEADINGFTLSKKSDPKTISEALSNFSERLQSVIKYHIS